MERIPELTDKEQSSLLTAGGFASWLQIVIALTMIFVPNQGIGPKGAAEYLELLQKGAFTTLISSDILSLMIVLPYLVSFPAIYVAMRNKGALLPGFATMFTIISVILCMVSNATFSMIHLGQQLANHSAEELMASANAILASDMWHSSAGYMAGLFMQGSGVLISIVMLKRKQFGKILPWAGLLGNGFDLIQHLIHPFVPEISKVILYFAGPFYLLWYPLLGWALFRMGKNFLDENTSA